MAIARKPKPTQRTETDVDVNALILKGGSVAGQPEPKTERAGEGKPSPVVVRIPSTLLEKIEEARHARAIKIPRHTWLLEAIVEKLDKESQQYQ
jgi:hypothetical protein